MARKRNDSNRKELAGSKQTLQKPKSVHFNSRVVSVLDRFIENCLLALLLLVPLLMTPKFSTLNLKEAIGQFLMLVALLAFLYRSLIRGRIEIPRCPQWLPFAALLAYAFVSLTFTPAKRTSIRDFMMFFSFSAGLLLFSHYLRHRRFRRLCLVVVVISTAVVALLANFQLQQIREFQLGFLPKVSPGSSERIWTSSTIGHNNGTAVFMMLGSFAALLFLLRAKSWLGRSLALLLLMLNYYIIIVCQTRAVWLAMPLALLVFFISAYWGRITKRNRARVFIISAGTLSLVLILALTFYAFTAKQNQESGLPTLGERLAQFSPEVLIVDTRARIAAIGAYMIADNPIFGHGFASFKYIYPMYQGEFFDKFPDSPLAPTGRHTDRAHNEYLQLWIELGLAGIVLTLWFLLAHLKFMYRTVSYRMQRERQLLVSAAAAASVGLLAVNVLSFEFHVASSVILTIFWTGILLQSGSRRTYRLNLGAFGQLRWLRNLTAIACFILIFLGGLYTVRNLLGNHNMILGRSYREKAYSYLTTEQKEGVVNNFKASIIHFDKAARLAPYDGLIQYELGETLGKFGEYYLNHRRDPATAEQYYNRALMVLTKASREYQYKGLYYSLGKVHAFLYYIKRHPQSADLAVKNYRTAFYIFPEEIFARDQLARFYWYTGKKEKGIEEWQKITEFYPEFTYDYLLQDARRGVKSGQIAMAEEFYKAAATVAPDDLAVLNEVASFYVKQKRPEEAFSIFEKYRKSENDPEDMLKLYYSLCLETGDSQQLQRVLKRASAQDRYHALQQLYSAHLDRGESDKALEVLDEVLQLDIKGPKLRRTYRDKFRGLWQKGDLEGIVDTWKQSTETLETPNTEKDFYLAQYPLNLPVLTCLTGISCL